MRRFVDERIRPIPDDLAHGVLAPCGVLRDVTRTVGLDERARARVAPASKPPPRVRTQRPEDLDHQRPVADAIDLYAEFDDGDDTDPHEPASVAAMALGIIEECERIAIAHASERVPWGQPLARLPLMQRKLAPMEAARLHGRSLAVAHPPGPPRG